MGHYAARNGVEGYLADDGTFYPDRTTNRGVIPGYNDALAANKSRLALQKAQRKERSLVFDQRVLGQDRAATNFAKALSGLVGAAGGLDPELARIDAAQETNKGQLYNWRRNIDQHRVKNGLPPLHDWKGGLWEPSVPPRKYRDSSASENSLVPGQSILGIPDSQFSSHYGLPDRNVPHVTSGELARKSEADRMMQQYASDEYWDTEAGKAMMELGGQESYEGDNLAEFYNAQQAVGTGTIDEIIDGMGYTGNMETWARANPALALREYQKNSEALPTDGYAGTGTGELQSDERLNDILNYSGAYTQPTADKFLQKQVDQLEKREDGPLWGPGPGDPPPVDQTQEQTPTGFPLPSQADGLSELLQSLGTREILNQIDETGGGLAEQAGEWYGRKTAQEFPGANWPVIGDLIQDEGARRGGEKGREYWNQGREYLNQYTGLFPQ